MYYLEEIKKLLLKFHPTGLFTINEGDSMTDEHIKANSLNQKAIQELLNYCNTNNTWFYLSNNSGSDPGIQIFIHND